MEFTEIISTVTLALTVAVLGYLVFSLLWGLFRGWKKATIRLVTVLISAVVAIPVAGAVMDAVGHMIEEALVSAIMSAMPDAAALQTEVDMLSHYVGDLVSAVATPLVFAVVFLVLTWFTSIIYAILKAIFIRKGTKEGYFRYVGAPIGLVTGLLIVVCLMAPVVGIVNTVDTVMAEITEQERADLAENDPSLPETLDTLTMIGDLSEQFPFNMATMLGSGAIYNQMTVFEAPADTETNVEHELIAIAHLIPGALELVDEFSKPEDPNTGMPDFDFTEAADLLVPNLDHSEYLATILTELLRTAGEKWDRGEEFLGMNLREMAESSVAFSAVVDHFIDDLVATDRETMADNLDQVLENITLLSHTATYVSMVTDSNKTTQDMKEQMDKVVTTLNPDNIDVLRDVLTEEVMAESQIPEQASGTISSLLSEVFTQVSEMENEEEKLGESEAINTFISYAGQLTDENKSVSESELIDTVLESEAVSKVLQDNMQNGERETIELEEEKKEELINILNEKSENATEEEQATLDAIADLFGLEGYLNGGELPDDLPGDLDGILGGEGEGGEA